MSERLVLIANFLFLAFAGSTAYRCQLGAWLRKKLMDLEEPTLSGRESVSLRGAGNEISRLN